MLHSLRARLAGATLAVPVALGLVLVMTGTASAGTTLTTTGGSLLCNVYKTGTFTGYADCWLKDTLSDKRQVYAVTRTEGFPEARISNSGGDGTTLYFKRNIHGDTRTWYWSYKVCRKVNLGSDNCSSTQTIRA